MSVDDMRKKYPGVAEDYLQMLSGYQEFVNREIMPRRRDLDGGPFHRDAELAERTFNELTQKLIDIDGVRGQFPVEVGGAGLGGFEFWVPAEEELSRGDCGLTLHMSLASWAMMAALLSGNMRVILDFIPEFCGNKPYGACVAITEPDGGCNVTDRVQMGHTIRTTARLDGDEWVINGQKLWPSSSGTADVYMTLCTTDASKGDEGIALIYVPRETPGLSFGPPEAKMGLVYTEYNGAIYYDNVRVPREYRAAGPGTDAELFHDVLTIGRIGTAGLALGPAQGAFEIAVEYTRNRYIAGKQVREHSMHAGMIADMAIALEAARAYYIQVAKMCDRTDIYGRLGSEFLHGKASGAKVLACDTAVMVTNMAMEIMGSMGCSEGMHVEKYLRDVKLMQLVEGGAQLGRLDMARALYPFQW